MTADQGGPMRPAGHKPARWISAVASVAVAATVDGLVSAGMAGAVVGSLVYLVVLGAVALWEAP